MNGLLTGIGLWLINKGKRQLKKMYKKMKQK